MAHHEIELLMTDMERKEKAMTHYEIDLLTSKCKEKRNLVRGGKRKEGGGGEIRHLIFHLGDSCIPRWIKPYWWVFFSTASSNILLIPKSGAREIGEVQITNASMKDKWGRGDRGEQSSEVWGTSARQGKIKQQLDETWHNQKRKREIVVVKDEFWYILKQGIEPLK